MHPFGPSASPQNLSNAGENGFRLQDLRASAGYNATRGALDLGEEDAPCESPSPAHSQPFLGADLPHTLLTAGGIDVPTTLVEPSNEVLSIFRRTRSLAQDFPTYIHTVILFVRDEHGRDHVRVSNVGIPAEMCAGLENLYRGLLGAFLDGLERIREDKHVPSSEAEGEKRAALAWDLIMQGADGGRAEGWQDSRSGEPRQLAVSRAAGGDVAFELLSPSKRPFKVNREALLHSSFRDELELDVGDGGEGGELEGEAGGSAHPTPTKRGGIVAARNLELMKVARNRRQRSGGSGHNPNDSEPRRCLCGGGGLRARATLLVPACLRSYEQPAHGA